MVRGLEKFKEYFKEYTGQYTFIGGTACDILLGKIGEDFRATKDLDIVLLLENLNDKFVNTFISFVEAGGYTHIDKGTGKNQFFRFSKPTDLMFPYMIELFSQKPDYLNTIATHLGPIHISDEVVSLSAILLEDEYYELLKNGMTVVDEISVLNLEHIILFKMKAWLDLSHRKISGEKIDSKDIKKHKNDIFRLISNIDKDIRLPISGQIRSDAELFLKMVNSEPIDLKNLNIKNVTYTELLDTIATCYDIK